MLAPSSNFRFLPETRPAGSQINHRPRHVRVTALIRAHAVALGQSEQVGHALCVDQILGVDLGAHDFSLRGLTSSLSALVYGCRQRVPRRCANTPGRGRGIDDSMWLARAHGVGHLRHQVNLIGCALMVNSLALFEHDNP